MKTARFFFLRVIQAALPICWLTLPAQSATIMVPEEASLIDAVASAGAGDTISIADGTYPVTDTLTVAVDNLTLEGRSGAATSVRLDAEGGAELILYSSGTVGLTVRDLLMWKADSLLGGAFYIENCTDVALANVQIFDCTTVVGSIAVLLNTSAALDDCKFQDTTCENGQGGALFVGSLDGTPRIVSINETVFFQNTNEQGDAGALFVQTRAAKKKRSKGTAASPPLILDVSGCLFRSLNAPDGFGGAVYFQPEGAETLSATFTNTIFDANRAQRGAGICLDRRAGDGLLTVRDCRFQTQRASSTGGAILVYDEEAERKQFGTSQGTELAVSNCLFRRNQANFTGGAVSILYFGGALNYRFESNTFVENNALNDAGGAILLGGLLIAPPKEDEKQIVFGSEFAGEILDNTFENNTVGSMGFSGFGGALSLNATDAVARGNRFYKNSARFGGAVSLMGDEGLIEENVFGTIEGDLMGNRASFGAGVNIALTSAKGRTKGEPQPVSLRVINNLFDSNIANARGAGFLLGGADPFGEAFIGGNFFVRNYSEDGAAHAVDLGSAEAEVYLVHNTLINNYDPTKADPEKGGAPPDNAVITLFGGPATIVANNIVANSLPTNVTGTHQIDTFYGTARLLSNVYFNLGDDHVVFGSGTFNAEETNLLPGNGGNSSVDPLFELPEQGNPVDNPNPHLSPFSPLLNMATDVLSSTQLFLLNLPTDIDSLLAPPGDPRILGPRADVGADETMAQPTPTPSSSPTDSPTASPTPTFTEIVPTMTDTPGGPTATESPTITPGGPSLTPTNTITPGGPTETPTPTNTPGGSTETPTPTRTPIDCDILPGNNPALNPRCDCFDLIALLEDRKGAPPNLDKDFDNDGNEDVRDFFLFAVHWYHVPQ